MSIRSLALLSVLALELSPCHLLVADTAVSLTSIPVPASGQPGITSVTLTGSGFPPGSILPASVLIALSPSGTGSAFSTPATAVTTVVGSTRRVTFLIPGSISLAAPTAFQIAVSGQTTAGTQFSSSNRASLTINPNAKLVSLSPMSASVGQTASVQLNGQYTSFLNGTTQARFGAGIAIGAGAAGGYGTVLVTSPTSAVARITIDNGASLGSRDVSIKTGQEVATMAAGFTVNASGGPPAPSVLTLNGYTSPATALPGDNVTITGSGFPSGEILPASIAVSLAPAAGVTGPSFTIAPTSITPSDGSARQVAFQVPTTVRFTTAAAYAVLVSGTTSSGIVFSSAGPSSLTIGAAVGRSQCELPDRRCLGAP